MQRYRESLDHLNAALNIMVDQGDTCMVANIAHPIGLIERVLRERNAASIMRHFPEQPTR